MLLESRGKRGESEVCRREHTIDRGDLRAVEECSGVYIV
jgi:hypothetical protein